MNITQVKIFPVEEDKLKAFVSIVFDHCFMVNDIKVIQGRDGLFLSMPSRRKKTGEFKDVAHPLNNETRREIEETVLSEYRAMVDDVTPRRPDRLEDDEDDASQVAPPSSVPPSSVLPPAARPLPSPPAASMPGTLAAAPAEAAPAMSVRGAMDGPQPTGRDGGPATEGDDRDRTLEEVQEMHLSDSFWSVS